MSSPRAATSVATSSADAAIGEAHQHLLALALVEFAVQGQRRLTPRSVELRRRVRAVPAGCCRTPARTPAGARASRLQQGAGFCAGSTSWKCCVTGFLRAPSVDRHIGGLALEAPADGAHGIGEGRRIEQGLALRWASPPSCSSIASEKPMSSMRSASSSTATLIPPKCSLPLRLSSWMRPGVPDHQVRVVHQRGQLRTQRDAAAQGQQLDVGDEARQRADRLADLVGEFARGAQHQALQADLRRIERGEQAEAEGRRSCRCRCGPGR